MDNAAITRRLAEAADLLEIQDANPFRVRAYRNAARTVERQTEPLAEWVASGADLTSLPGIGAEMADHIVELGRIRHRVRPPPSGTGPRRHRPNRPAPSGCRRRGHDASSAR